MPTWNQIQSQLRHPDNPVVSVKFVDIWIFDYYDRIVIFTFAGKRLQISQIINILNISL